jgi:hypothetical protein
LTFTSPVAGAGGDDLYNLVMSFPLKRCPDSEGGLNENKRKTNKKMKLSAGQLVA